MINDTLNEAVEISADTYWVGQRDNNILERNSYLRVFKAGGKKINIVIDPGPPVDFESLSIKLSKIIGDPKNVQIVFINHQDPDVSYNATYLQKLNNNLIIIATQDTWRLIRFYGLNDNNFKSVESFLNYRVMLSTGHRLIFVPTPFLHFRGACMIYDPETQILFSGDFFGGLSAKNSGLYVTEKDWDGIKSFHQIYMPSKDAIKLAIDSIRKLAPAPLVIAPQHGGMIQGEILEEFIKRMYTLEVGIDLIKDTRLNSELKDLLNEIINELKQHVPEEEILSALKSFILDKTFPDLAIIRDGKVIEIKTDAVGVFGHIIKSLLSISDKNTKILIRAKVVKALLDRNLPLLDLDQGAGVEVPEFFEG
ncbi:MAG: MBL fold metallo-hydrolase [Deltaproteobacteria bacterium]|nr:MBL fold metallo-hydrolase [Deltaproteobacteria bacterium]MCL5792455.1 MBL fold metallo-hydrolase [Deltaproteobacteria bacterium]